MQALSQGLYAKACRACESDYIKKRETWQECTLMSIDECVRHANVVVFIVIAHLQPILKMRGASLLCYVAIPASSNDMHLAAPTNCCCCSFENENVTAQQSRVLLIAHDQLFHTGVNTTIIGMLSQSAQGQDFVNALRTHYALFSNWPNAFHGPVMPSYIMDTVARTSRTNQAQMLGISALLSPAQPSAKAAQSI